VCRTISPGAAETGEEGKVTSKEIEGVIKSLMNESDACHNDALHSEDQAEVDRSVHAEQHANLLQALFEIAYQLAVQNERNARYESARSKMEEHFDFHREP
jgi:hypothetical protein